MVGVARFTITTSGDFAALYTHAAGFNRHEASVLPVGFPYTRNGSLVCSTDHICLIEVTIFLVRCFGMRRGTDSTFTSCFVIHICICIYTYIYIYIYRCICTYI